MCPRAIPNDTGMSLIFEGKLIGCVYDPVCEMGEDAYKMTDPGTLPASSCTRFESDHTRSLDTVKSHSSLCENRARVTVSVCAAILFLTSFQFDVSKSRITA